MGELEACQGRAAQQSFARPEALLTSEQRQVPLA